MCSDVQNIWYVTEHTISMHVLQYEMVAGQTFEWRNKEWTAQPDIAG